MSRAKISIKPKLPPTADPEYNELCLELTKSLSLTVKKNQGIFFTPFSTVKQILHEIRSYPIKSVLEPSCGSGQFLEHLKYSDITAVEYNNDIYQLVSTRYSHVQFSNEDFLAKDFGTRKFDLVIGNPPYFVIPKKSVQAKYLDYINGRPNIYVLFILKSLHLLNDNGILAFVLPCNFLNCSYYNKLRELIATEFTILNIIQQRNLYLDTDQKTCVLIVQKRVPANGNSRFTVTFPEHVNMTVFNTPELAVKISELLRGTTTLSALGFDVKVGNVVWNQCKDILTDDDSKTRLIYSGDIEDGLLKLKKYADSDKKNFINQTGTKDTVLLVNRGYGKGKYVFKYFFLEKPTFNYLIENHVSCVYRSDGTSKHYESVIDSFNDPRTLEFVDLYFENNAINTTELKYILPIRV
jgi:adenine-specific DNA-methyltransferase